MTILHRAWQRLPSSVQQRLRPLIWTARRYRGQVEEPAVAPATVPHVPSEADESDIEVLRTLDDLDRKLVEIDAAWAISDDEMRRVFKTFRMEFPLPLPEDPFDPVYRERQFEVYQRISGRPGYTTDNERSDFPMDPQRPFPYYTESHDTVSHQLMAVGYIIMTMRLPAKASVLELGVGWGNTTIALARMGYEVTAVDIEPKFVQLVNDRARLVGLPPPARVGSFLDVGSLERRFDAVLFYECFHHCSDHMSLLRQLHEVLAPGGRVFFAAEPITDAFSMPWGIRLDGESLWAIRRNGWLELGFQEGFFRTALERCGYSVVKHVTPATHLGVIFEATPLADAADVSSMANR
jgi:SAM-dependent methyltransferase